MFFIFIIPYNKYEVIQHNNAKNSVKYVPTRESTLVCLTR